MYWQFFTKALILIVVLNYSYAKMYNNDLFDYVIKNKMLSNGFNIMLIVIALFYLFNRDFFLPFLGPTAMPIVAFHPVKKDEKLVNVNLTGLPTNTQVVYWASSESETTFENPMIAYQNYQNSGTAKTDEMGNVEFSVSCPGVYKVPYFGFMKKVLPKHVHYRYELPYRGLFSRVYTKNIDQC